MSKETGGGRGKSHKVNGAEIKERLRATEYVEHLMRLHKLQGVLLKHLFTSIEKSARK